MTRARSSPPSRPVTPRLSQPSANEAIASASSAMRLLRLSSPAHAGIIALGAPNEATGGPPGHAGRHAAAPQSRE